MQYIVITENDSSLWQDKTGELYHFPSRYLKLLQKGNSLLYYKGRQRDEAYSSIRLTKEPHYFGIAKVGRIHKDVDSLKNDYFAEIIDFTPFSRPVGIKNNQGEYLEYISSNRTTNYWRDGVREISQQIFEKIIALSGLKPHLYASFNDYRQGDEEALTTVIIEGSRKTVYSTKYERSRLLRQKALFLHGYSCMVCSFDFEKVYGNVGKGFIHVHHVKPISEAGEAPVDPRTDLVVVCPNCHAMIHRNKYKILW